MIFQETSSFWNLFWCHSLKYCWSEKPVLPIENKLVLSFGTDEQFTNLPFQGYGSSLWIGSNLNNHNERRRMLSIYQPCRIQQRCASTSNRVTLSSKIKPALSNAKQKSKEGWANFVSQVDVSKYQDRKWYIRPISDIYFSWCFTKVSTKHNLEPVVLLYHSSLYATRCLMPWNIWPNRSNYSPWIVRWRIV